MSLEQRIRAAEADLFAAVGTAVDESFLSLPKTGLRLRLLAHGTGPPLVLLHGVSLSAAVWAPLLTALPGHRLLAVDLPATACPTRSATGRRPSADTHGG